MLGVLHKNQGGYNCPGGLHKSLRIAEGIARPVCIVLFCMWCFLINLILLFVT